MEVSLYFDGACSPNPGRGGCGAVVYGRHGKELLRESCPLGTAVSNNVAEYSGLIIGLRGILRHLEHARGRSMRRHSTEVTVNVYGDSELVIFQMTGRYKVRSHHLNVLNAAADGLVSRFSGVHFHHIRRETNVVADGIARSAQEGYSTIREEDELIFYPNKCGFTRARIGDCRAYVNASDDRGAAFGTSHVLIDASFFASLPTYCARCLRTLSDSPYQLCGDGSLVLGVLSERHLILEVLDFDYEDLVDIHCVITDAIVVDRLPVPLHISYDHPAIGGPIGVLDACNQLTPNIFPEEYARHPYWRTMRSTSTRS